MNNEEAVAILFALAASKREHADSLRDIDGTGVKQRRALLDQQADALDMAIEALAS